MDEMDNQGIDAFESGLFGGDYRLESEEGSRGTEARENEAPEADSDGISENEQEGEKESETEENPEAENTPESEKTPDTANEQSNEGNQTFTLKVNHEEREVSLAEMTALAQKGLDYDRAKDQIAARDGTIAELNERLKENREALDTLALLSEKSGTPVKQLLESLYVSYRKGAGVSEDAAKLELEKAQLAKELEAARSQSAKQERQEEQTEAEGRMRREMEEFKAAYPGVEITDEIAQKIGPDIRAGMSLTAAYRKLEKQRQEDRIAELERQLAAQKQNKRNRRSSPGSQSDSGGSTGRSDADIFERALFG